MKNSWCASVKERYAKLGVEPLRQAGEGRQNPDAVAKIARALEVDVVAEGVETVEELAYLQAATRIRHAQGYYFAKPMFIDELTPTRLALPISA